MNDIIDRFKELQKVLGECYTCEHYQPYTRADGSIGMRCTTQDSCIHTPKAAKVTPISDKGEAFEDDMKWDAAQYMADQEGDEKDGE